MEVGKEKFSLYLPPPLIMNISSFMDHHINLRLLNCNWNNAIVSMHDFSICDLQGCHARCSTLQQLVERRERLHWMHAWSICRFEITKLDLDFCAAAFNRKSLKPLNSVDLSQSVISAIQLPNLLNTPLMASVTKLSVTIGSIFFDSASSIARSINFSPMLTNLHSLAIYFKFRHDNPSKLFQIMEEQDEVDRFPTELIENCEAGSNLFHITELRLSTPMDEPQLISFCACPGIINLKSLHITGKDFTSEGLKIFGSSTNFTCLTSLSLIMGSKLPVTVIFNSPSLSSLKFLQLGCGLQSHDFVLQSSCLTSLACLDLSLNKLDSTVLPLISSAPWFKNLKELYINSCDVRVPGLWKESAQVKQNIQTFALAANANLPNLRYLRLSTPPLPKSEWPAQYMKTFPQLSRLSVE